MRCGKLHPTLGPREEGLVWTGMWLISIHWYRAASRMTLLYSGVSISKTEVQTSSAIYGYQASLGLFVWHVRVVQNPLCRVAPSEDYQGVQIMCLRSYSRCP